MVAFYRPSQKKNVKKPMHVSSVRMGEWDAQGKAIAQALAPVTFVEGALPGEQCAIRILSSHKSHQTAAVTKVLSAHPQRVTPFCAVYEQCGGCQLQHVARPEALAWRQQAIDQQLQKALKVTYLPWRSPLVGLADSYRRSARLAIDARDPQHIKLGFRQQQDKSVVDVGSCPILVPALSDLLTPIKEVLEGLEGVRHIGHIQLLAGDNVAQVNVHVTRALPPSSLAALTDFARQHEVNLSITSAQSPATYLHQQDELRCHTDAALFLSPTINDFVQVNAEVNRLMIRQAMQWLAPQQDERILDLFSGIGNFSLSLANQGARVCAVEGVAEMVQAARENAHRQSIDTIDWQCADLNEVKVIENLLSQPVSKVLLDPSREGAFSLCSALATSKVESILYVSCNPATFIRDAQRLVSSRFEIAHIGLVEMFPYTRHLEIMALFVPRMKHKGSQ